MKIPKERTRKVTMNLPVSLIEDYGKNSPGLTEIVREALKLYKRKMLYAKLEALKGKINFGATWQELKHDRE